MPVRDLRDNVQVAAEIGLEVGECSETKNHICGLSPSRQSNGSMRLSKDHVEDEKRGLDRALRGITFECEAKEEDPIEETTRE